MVGIVSWGSYIPCYRITVEEIAKAHGMNPLQIKESLFLAEKSVPGIDEDAATIAVEAARNSLKTENIDPTEIGAIYIGSESHPYAVKPTGTIVGEAIVVGNNYTTADFEFACKAGTAALQAAIAMVKSKMAKLALAGGADTAQAEPGDMLEYTAAAGGAVFIIGNENVAAEINETVSFTSDTPDFWRRQQQKYPAHGGAFTGEPAYFRHVMESTKMLMDKCGTSPKDYQYVIFHQPNGKFPMRVSAKLGFTEKQFMPGLLVTKIGNTYSAASLLGLAAVLDIAKPGERILLTSYGSGAGSDSFDITVTEKIISARKNLKTVESQIKKKIYLDYAKYLRNTNE
ncbi:MAG: hydroxymethylglutaryl-CoA synthase [archaeon]